MFAFRNRSKLRSSLEDSYRLSFDFSSQRVDLLHLNILDETAIDISLEGDPLLALQIPSYEIEDIPRANGHIAV